MKTFEELVQEDVKDHLRYAERHLKELKDEFIGKLSSGESSFEYEVRWKADDIVMAEHTLILLKKLADNLERLYFGTYKITVEELMDECITTLKNEIIEGRFIEQSTNAINNEFKRFQQQAQSRLVVQLERVVSYNKRKVAEYEEDK